MTPVEASYRNSTEEERQDRAVLAELPQVYYLARRIHERLPRHVPLEDLVHAGVLGLIAAFRNFDVTKNVQFKSFAQFRIRGAILDSLRELDWGSRRLRRNGRSIDEAISRLAGKLGRQPEEDEIASELGIQLTALHKLLGRLDGLDVRNQQTNCPDDHGESLDLVENASELFVSGAEGCKVAFLAKTTWFNHRGMSKHDLPMTGKIYIGPVEMDDSTGQEQFQLGLPVLDRNKPIGSVVVGLRVANLR